MKALKNNFYILHLIWTASPSRIIFSILQVCFSYSYGAFYTLILFRYVVNALQNGTSFKIVLLFLIFNALLGLSIGCFNNWFRNIYAPKTDQTILEYLNTQVYNKAVNADLSCYDDPNFYDIFTKSTAQINEKSLEILDKAIELIGGIWMFLLNGVFAILVEPAVLIIAIIPSILVFISERAKSRKLNEYELADVPYKRQSEYVKRTVYLRDYAKDIRLSNIFSVLRERLDGAITGLVQNAKTYGICVAIYRFCAEFSIQILMYIVLEGYIAYRYLVHSAFTLGDYASLTGAIINLNLAIDYMSENVSYLYKSGLYCENLRTFLQAQPKIVSGAGTPRFKHELSLENVSFGYGGKQVLSNISLSIKKGEKIAIVGRNGSGKTTLIKLLMRLYDPTIGRLCLDGDPIASLNLPAYRKQFTTAFQDFQIFGVSIAENVLLRTIRQEDEGGVISALKNAGIFDKIAALPQGIYTTLTREFDENGVVFSGGEAQKIAIARVFASPAPIAILDEPSSALDPIAESKMFESLAHACADKTVIFISHRLSSTVSADRIYMLENGEIIEQGSHAQLMALGGKYAEMFTMQAEKYVGGEPCEA